MTNYTLKEVYRKEPYVIYEQLDGSRLVAYEVHLKGKWHKTCMSHSRAMSHVE